MISVTAIRCPTCKDIIYSRAHHDFRSCTCEDTAIDGGFDYTRILGKPELFKELKTFSLDIQVSKKDLFDDWNRGINKYGLIKDNLA